MTLPQLPVRTGSARARALLRRQEDLPRPLLAALLVALALLLTEHLSFAAARLPVAITITATGATIAVDGSLLRLGWQRAPTAVALVGGPALAPEFQLDGTDSVNNFTQDPAYLDRLQTSPYYGLQAWMRDLGGASAWRDLSVRAGAAAQAQTVIASPIPSAPIALPAGAPLMITAALERPEAAARLLFLCDTAPCAEVVFNRNDRYIAAHTLDQAGNADGEVRAYFPTRPLVFAAEVINLLARLGLAALALLGITVAIQIGVVLLARRSGGVPALTRQEPPQTAATSVPRVRIPWPASWRRPSGPRDSWDWLAMGMALGSCALTLSIARAEYNGLPHILDAAALYFQAKIFAGGHLAAPVPADASAFTGPFMVLHDGRWFAQYAPGTPAVLAIGMLLHVPWVIEPLLGTLALWALYQIGRLLFSPATGALALLLAALSPFYGFLAASYLTHTVALFFGSYFLLFLLRFLGSHRAHQLALAAACLGGLGLTRELSAVLLGVGATLPVVALHRQGLWKDRARVLSAALVATPVLVAAVAAYMLYDLAQTGNALVTPRSLFFPGDVYGFGPGIGFYGQHTLAAGLVNLHQLLTMLLIDLSGWPFYLTLAFVPLAFLHRDDKRCWDGLMLWLAAVVILAQVGYFYHGIYLGPRYIYEALPWLQLLTARGILALLPLLGRASARVAARTSHRLARGLVMATVALLLACNLLYYYPRQLALYAHYSGLPASLPLDVTALYAAHPAHAVIVTDNWYVYNYDLWPLNDPALRGTTLYAYAASAADQEALRAAYPDRTLYALRIAPDGHVSLERQ